MWKREQHKAAKLLPDFFGNFRHELTFSKRRSYPQNFPLGDTFQSSSGIRKRFNVENREPLPLSKEPTERDWDHLQCSPVDDFAPYEIRSKDVNRERKKFLADRTEILLDEKTQKLLTHGEKITLNFYCNEYITKAMTVDAFVAVLLELLDHPSKYTLMTEIRGLIRPKDLDKFDELIYRRELQAMRSKAARRFLVGNNHEIRIDAPSEESGLNFNDGIYSNEVRRLRNQQRIARGISHHYSFNIHEPRKNARALHRGMLRRHSSGGGDDYTGFLDIKTPEERRWSVANELANIPTTTNNLSISPEAKGHTLEVPHPHVRRHRSLPDPHARSRTHEQHRSASVRLPGHKVIQENNGMLRVIIKKTKPLLGIVIEGGSNTSQPLPRIISIHASGAAFEAGGLKIGHIILEVDGMKMKKKRHNEREQRHRWNLEDLLLWQLNDVLLSNEDYTMLEAPQAYQLINCCCHYHCCVKSCQLLFACPCTK